MFSAMHHFAAICSKFVLVYIIGNPYSVCILHICVSKTEDRNLSSNVQSLYKTLFKTKD